MTDLWLAPIVLPDRDGSKYGHTSFLQTTC
jgi:hypothetical protein